MYNVIEDYLKETDWRVKENSNTSFSFAGLQGHIAQSATAQFCLDNMYKGKIAEAHKKKFFHLHDLGTGLVGYAFDGDLNKIVVRHKITGEKKDLTFSEFYSLLDSSYEEIEKGVFKKNVSSWLIQDNNYEPGTPNRWVEIESLIEINEEKDIYEIELESGEKLYVTEEHKCIIINEDEKFEIKETNELKEGDIFAVKRGRKTKGLTHKEIYGEEEAKRRLEKISSLSNNLSEESSKSKSSKLSEFAKKRTGEKNPFYGKHHSKENKEKASERVKKWHQEGNYLQKTKEYRENLFYEKRKTYKCEYCGEEFLDYISLDRKFCSPHCVGMYNIENGIFNKKINNWELIVSKSSDKINYVGDHNFWITGSKNGRIFRKNPDFIVVPFKETKKVIEVWGDFWHTEEEKEEIKDFYEELGISCLFLTSSIFNEYRNKEKELLEIITNKVETFINE